MRVNICRRCLIVVLLFFFVVDLYGFESYDILLLKYVDILCLFLFEVSEFEILGLRSLTREDDSRCREEG